MVLQTVWFFLWGLLWAIFFVTDGFDFGIGVLYPFLGKSERDKRIMIHAIGPLWDGNEVWLIMAGGVTFAAFPLFYSVMFSTLYSPLMIILFALIIRGVSFEFRNKIECNAWKKIWDMAIFTGSLTPAILFGVTFANIFRGIPVDQNGTYHGNLMTFLNPYGILGGGFFLCLFLIHGALWLTLRSDGELQIRSEKIAVRMWPILTSCFIIFLIATNMFTDLYDNYIKYPALLLVILGMIGGIFGIRYFLARKSYLRSWIASATVIAGFILFGVIGLFPNLFKSSINETYNITAFNSSSSPLTLKIMLIVIVIFMPIVLGYQIWAYNIFRDKISIEDLTSENTY